jgi:CDP-diacylglycerol--glycerol-3-phosphate 3-phosphatidyltransferase
MTDFLDGYLARRYGLETPIGRALDPIADKFLVCSALIALLAIHKIYFMWVIILIGREICMLSLRQLAALNNIQVPVSYLGKIKACLQMFLIIILIIAKPLNTASYFNFWFILEHILIILTLYYSLISFARYIAQFSREYLKLI